MTEPSQKRTNRLAKEKSPYLLQHASNPVDWYPWGSEAFDRARKEEKPIFLSIGYSTCHWCHVMEHESFENDEVADLLNRNFVSIKVDREERPDIDRVYMAFVQATTGSGGWPMSVFLTPDLAPFFGGTYFPPDSRYGRPGFPMLLERIESLWREQRASLVASSQEILTRLTERIGASPKPEALSAEVLQNAYRVFGGIFDAEHGGFGDAPKFPRPVVHNLLLRHAARTGTTNAFHMVRETLFRMATGGVYDHLGGGFHRYSVDKTWHVPHFEKMLYDQAQLAVSYLEAYQVTGEAFLARIARDTLDYVLRDLTCRQTGGFFSAEDADSATSKEPGAAKTEGAFYVWTWKETVDVLGQDLARLFSHRFDVRPEGNAQASDPHGELEHKNVLHITATLSEVAQAYGTTEESVSASLGEARGKLLEARGRRPRPHLDDKILCGWNGLMISALAQASTTLGDERYLDAARRAAKFIAETLLIKTEPGGWRLARRYRDGDVAADGQLEDYACYVQALIDLYEATFEPHWLELGQSLCERMIELFEDRAVGGFYATTGKDPSILIRSKEMYDGAEPSGNAIAVLSVLRLAELLGRDDWATVASRALEAGSGAMVQSPQGCPQLLVAWDFADGGATDVVFSSAKDDTGLRTLQTALARTFVPRKVSRWVSPDYLGLASRSGPSDSDRASTVAERLPHLSPMATANLAAYVCHNRSCQAPVMTPEALSNALPALRLPGPSR